MVLLLLYVFIVCIGTDMVLYTCIIFAVYLVVLVKTLLTEYIEVIFLIKLLEK